MSNPRQQSKSHHKNWSIIFRIYGTDSSKLKPPYVKKILARLYVVSSTYRKSRKNTWLTCKKQILLNTFQELAQNNCKCIIQSPNPTSTFIEVM